MFGLGAVVPELHVAFGIESALFEELAFLRKNVFQGDGLVGEDLDVSAVVAYKIRRFLHTPSSGQR